jgi:hypothetical protein
MPSRIRTSKTHDEPHEGDLGTELQDRWALIADDLSAYQNAVANESYLGTSRVVWVSVLIAGLGVAAVLAVAIRRRKMHRIDSAVLPARCSWSSCRAEWRSPR